MTQESRFERRERRTRYQLRKKASGKPRLSVFRSGKHIYAQLIDDAQGVTLAAASTVEKELRAKLKKSGSTKDAAKLVGELIAARASKAKVTDVVFDRGGYLFHGRVASLAEAARAGGLKF